MKRNKLDKKKFKKMYSLRTGAPENVMRLSLVLKEMTNLKKSLMINGIKKVVTTGQDPHPAKFLTCKKELKKSLGSERKK